MLFPEFSISPSGFYSWTTSSHHPRKTKKRRLSQKITVFEMNLFSELILEHGFSPVSPTVPDLTHFFWVRVKLGPVVEGHERSIWYDCNDIIQMMKFSPRSLLKIWKIWKILSGLMDNDDLVFRINDISSGPKNAFRQIMWWVMWPRGPAWPHVMIITIGQSRDHNVKFH